MPSKRVLALDVGTVRVGVAVTDPLCVFAQGVGVWNVKPGAPNERLNEGLSERLSEGLSEGLRPFNFEGWKERFDECIAKYDPRIVIIGLPRRTTGRPGPEEARVEALVAELRALYPDRAFETCDERFTTVMAEKALIEGNVSRAKRKGQIDKVAATIILQSWLDGESFSVSAGL
ncbi:putative pre-16S rRNA nuclease [Synergistales bacterium]|nr:putative pre-16S rRNA nuclease [Synergistales bacterium]